MFEQLLHSVLQSTQTMVFMSIAAASFLFVCASFFMGGHDHDHDVSHDVGHDHDHGGHDHGGTHEFSTVSFFSPKVLSIFTLAFGASGAVASVFGCKAVVCTTIGLVSGFLLALVALYALRLLYSQQANSLVTNSAIVGVTARVTTRIPSYGVGEITLVAARQSMTRLARSKGGREISTGVSVKVLEVSGDALVVEPVK